MAAGYKDFVAGATLAAADLEDYCELQGIMRFASAAARDSALSGVLTEGLHAYLIDTNAITVYSGSAWSTVGPVHGGWTSYTPSWTATVTNPTIGNGTIVGAYQRVGRNVLYRFSILVGSTTTVGSGVYLVSTPFTAANVTQIGTATFFDNSTGFFTHLDAYLGSGTAVIQFPLGTSSTNQWGASTPAVPATSDVLAGWISFECASDA